MLCISSWRDLETNVARLDASHVVSLLGLEGPARRPLGVAAANHLNLEIDDIVEELGDFIPPNAEHVERVLAFAANWDRARPMVVHCFAGISRSSAAALMILSLFNPGREEAVARRLRQLGPHLHPNRRLVALADQALDRDGRLLAALEVMGPSDIQMFAPPVDIAVDQGGGE